MRSKRLLVVMGVVVAILLGGVASASIPGPDGMIHGCVKNSNGDVMAIDHTAICPSGWTALNWNQAGPQGPQGPAGGVSGYEIVGQSNAASDNFQSSTFAFCPSGKKAIGGGWRMTNNEFVVVQNEPFLGSGDAWHVVIQHPGATSIPAESYNVFAVCATVA